MLFLDTGFRRDYGEGVAYRDYFATDELMLTWELFEVRLRSSTGMELSRMPQQRAFWFGWHAAFPETEWIQAKPDGAE